MRARRQPRARRHRRSPQSSTRVLMAASVGDFRPEDTFTQGELAAVLASLGAPVGVASPDSSVTVRSLDARRSHRRAPPGGNADSARRAQCWSCSAVVARHRNRGADARLADQPRARERDARTSARAVGDAGRGGILDRSRARPDGRRPRDRSRGGCHLRSAVPDGLAARSPGSRPALRRISVRLGGHLRAQAEPRRQAAPGRLRLLWLRLARLQARTLRRRSVAHEGPSWADDL